MLKKIKMLSSLLVVSSLVTSTMSLPSFAVDITSKDAMLQEAIEHIPAFISMANENPEGFGFSVTSDSVISIGEEIPLYDIVDGEFENVSDISYFPIYADDSVIAVCTIVFDGNQYSFDSDCPISAGLKEVGGSAGHVIVVNGYNGTDEDDCLIVYYNTNEADDGYYKTTYFSSTSGGFLVPNGVKTFKNVDYLC